MALLKPKVKSVGCQNRVLSLECVDLQSLVFPAVSVDLERVQERIFPLNFLDN